MVRGVLGFVAIIGALGVGIAALNSRSPLDAERAIGAGIGVLIFVVALGLADLINVTYQVRNGIHYMCDILYAEEKRKKEREENA
jgi:hypothetical protein